MNDPNSYTQTGFNVTGAATSAAKFSILLNGSVPFTVSAWAYVRSMEDRADFLYKQDVFRLGTQGGKLYVEINGFPALWSDGKQHPITQDEWHYVACVYDGAQLYLYIDGELDCNASVIGTGLDNANPFLMANDLQGALNCVRIYDSALPASVLLAAMFQPDPAQAYVANFDFSLVPPADTSGNAWPLQLAAGTTSDLVTPGVGLRSSAYCQPIRDLSVNPGGRGTDSYSIQAWIRVTDPTTQLTSEGVVAAGQAILVNQALNTDSGTALYLAYDPVAKAYRLASLRGDITSAADSLLSKSTIPYSEWINVATTYDPSTGTVALYINGNLDSSQSGFGPLPPLTQPDLLIGGAVILGQPASGWTFQGQIQSVDVWAVTLSATQVQQWTSGYPIQEPGLAAHYDLSGPLSRNELTGAPIGMADRGGLIYQVSPATTKVGAAGGRERKAQAMELPFALLHPDVLARLRAEVNFADVPDLAKRLDEAAERELQADLSLLVPVALVPRLRERLALKWADTKQKMLERPLELPFVLTYHQLDGEHVLIHHTPHTSTLVFRAPLAAIDPCTMWRIRVIWTIVSGVLSVVGVTGYLTNKVITFVQTRILQNLALMNSMGGLGAGITAAILYRTIVLLYDYGVLWPLIKVILSTMGWWALGKLLVKLLMKFFGAALALAETIASLVVAVAQLIYVFTQEPAGCPLVPSLAETKSTKS